jgi:peroxiredoxin Q/BCP
MLSIGAQAPDLEIITHDGYKGPISYYWQNGPLILFFYPKDNTRVCTKQACTLQSSLSEFSRLEGTVVGSSTGSLESHRRFAKKHGLEFPLVVDQRGRLAKLYKAHRPIIGISKRITYVIAAGKIIGHHHTELSVDPHLAMIRDTLNAES